jgi:hypothetical protein
MYVPTEMEFDSYKGNVRFTAVKNISQTIGRQWIYTLNYIQKATGKHKKTTKYKKECSIKANVQATHLCKPVTLRNNMLGPPVLGK